jgi:hypothetical protein
LLRSDVPTDSSLRESIVSHLLIQCEKGKLLHRYSNNYTKLSHPKLAAQLHPYICDSSKEVDARDLAIDIAEVCEVSELQENLACLALDSSQSIQLRVSAAKALGKIGDKDTRLKLKPLAIEPLPEDEYDELQGYLLRTLWPEILTVEELFSILSLPKKRNFIGSYHVFTDLELVKNLKPVDLVVALNWLGNQGVRDFEHPFENLGNTILLKAWENFDLPGVAESFTKVALVQWRRSQEIITKDNQLQQQFKFSLFQDSKKRLTLIKQAVLLILKIEGNLLSLISSLTRSIVISEDIAWILGCIKETDSKQEQRIWATLIRIIFRNPELMPEEAKVILEVSQISLILYDELSYWTKTIDLESAEAVRIFTAYLREQVWQSCDQLHKPLVEPPPEERVLQCLERLEAGDLSAWWQLNMEMTLKPDSTHYDNELELDLTKLPGWQEAEEATQKRIIEGAKKYIQQFVDMDYGWIGQNTINRPIWAGYRSLWLLLQENPDFIDNLSSEIWKKWVPVIIGIPDFCDNQNIETRHELVRYAYLNAPEEVLSTLVIMIDKENRESEYLHILSCFNKCWDKRLKLTLLEKAKDPNLKPKCVGQLLEELLKHEFIEARDFAKSLISLPLSLVENEREKALIASRVLVENSDSSSWTFIWTFVQQDSSFGREVLELVALRYSYGIQLNLTEAQLTDLYIWLVRQYPYDEDPDRSNAVMAYLVTARDGIAGLKASVLSQLKERGTLDSCNEIQRIIKEFPKVTWLNRILNDAQVNMRRRTWLPPQPEEILQLVASREPSNTELSQQIDTIDRSIQDMARKPKIDKSINLYNSPVSGSVNTGDNSFNKNPTHPPNAQKGFDWKFWLSIITTITATAIAVAFSGVFNSELREFLNRPVSPQVEQSPRQ